MMKLADTVTGTVCMADATRRAACKNTYKIVAVGADGAVVTTFETRIEFVLYTAAGRGRKYRKATAAQAATFVAD